MKTETKKTLVRTTLQIRKADEQIFDKVRKFNFSQFVSEMMHSHGQDWIDEQVSKFQSLSSDNSGQS